MNTAARKQAGRTMPPKLKKDVATERVQIVAPATLMREVDEWRAQQRPIPGRSDAIRRLLKLALGAGKKRGDRG
jgi:metal-responsive CopG/Arc/MetJ family transcriptional regulator